MGAAPCASLNQNLLISYNKYLFTEFYPTNAVNAIRALSAPNIWQINKYLHKQCLATLNMRAREMRKRVYGTHYLDSYPFHISYGILLLRCENAIDNRMQANHCCANICVCTFRNRDVSFLSPDRCTLSFLAVYNRKF